MWRIVRQIEDALRHTTLRLETREYRRANVVAMDQVEPHLRIPVQHATCAQLVEQVMPVRPVNPREPQRKPTPASSARRAFENRLRLPE
jgi:hypothetical protein